MRFSCGLILKQPRNKEVNVEGGWGLDNYPLLRKLNFSNYFSTGITAGPLAGRDVLHTEGASDSHPGCHAETDWVRCDTGTPHGCGECHGPSAGAVDCGWTLGGEGSNLSTGQVRRGERERKRKCVWEGCWKGMVRWGWVWGCMKCVFGWGGSEGWGGVSLTFSQHIGGILGRPAGFLLNVLRVRLPRSVDW